MYTHKARKAPREKVVLGRRTCTATATATCYVLRGVHIHVYLNLEHYYLYYTHNSPHMYVGTHMNDMNVCTYIHILHMKVGIKPFPTL